MKMLALIGALLLGFAAGSLLTAVPKAGLDLLYGKDSSSGAASVIQTDGSNALKVVIQ